MTNSQYEDDESKAEEWRRDNGNIFEGGIESLPAEDSLGSLVGVFMRNGLVTLIFLAEDILRDNSIYSSLHSGAMSKQKEVDKNNANEMRQRHIEEFHGGIEALPVYDVIKKTFFQESDKNTLKIVCASLIKYINEKSNGNLKLSHVVQREKVSMYDWLQDNFDQFVEMMKQTKWICIDTTRYTDERRNLLKRILGNSKQKRQIKNLTSFKLIIQATNSPDKLKKECAMLMLIEKFHEASETQKPDYLTKMDDKFFYCYIEEHLEEFRRFITPDFVNPIIAER